ncbi:DUF4179 domain-containing protein [Paenibacillus puldeungensis]|uniref:DUF4179 domain-containing protein n=1 Tax=Paenibacillus puldeungensis TaxID=696536 RepID=A0ABW3S3V6_9BACL
MGKLSDRVESAEMEAIERMIRQSSMPKTSLNDNIMNRIGGLEMSRTVKFAKHKSNVMKRVALTTAATAILGGGIVGSGFVSPVMADALKQIPMFSTLFEGTSKAAVKTAIDQGLVKDPNLSVTHDGITLKLSDLLYDGTRLSFILDREGVDLPNTIVPFNLQEKPEDQIPKGYIKGPRPSILVNGKEIEFGKGGALPSVFGDFGKRQNAYIAEIPKGEANWGNEFELTIRAEVTGVHDVFEFKVPVKTEDNTVLLKPNATKTYEDFSYTVKELAITPVTTRLVIDSTGKVPRIPEQSGDYIASMMYYDIVDDQGNLLDQRRTGLFYREPDTKYHIDELYSPFKVTPKSITIKPYTLTVNTKTWKAIGEDQGRLGTKTYIKDMEMTIPVEK